MIQNRAGTFRVEVLQKGVTKIWILGVEGALDRYEERPYEHWLLVAGMDGLSEIAARAYVRRHPFMGASRDGNLETRVRSHEQHLADVAEERSRRRSDSAKAAWRDRKKRAEEAKKRSFPPLKAVP